MILNLENLIKKYDMKITGVIHIGAHFGEEHSTYKKLNIQDIIYFEPVKKTFNVLKERIKDAQLYNFALGNNNTFIEMYIEKSDSYGCSSILEPSSNYINVSFDEKEIVEMKKLDDFNFIDFNFLNIDVQGYELEVLLGSTKTLEKVDYIMCEINRITPQKKLDYINSTTVDKLIEFLSKFNFKLVEESWEGISWGDGLFIKEKN